MSESQRVPVLVIAGVSSGVGKTTVTLGILEALRRRGLTVQGFKVGPDFIDPGFHALATGRPADNLDSWMCGHDHVVTTVARRTADVDLAVVEGVMGCFDGLEGASEAGSTAEIAKWLGAPVVLVLDAGAMARSAAAVLLGFERFDTDVELAGVIFNRVGGPVHRQWLNDAVAASCQTRVLGALPHEPALALPERHLGLVTAAEGGYSDELRGRLAELVEQYVDVGALLDAARSRIERRPPDRVGSCRQGAAATIAVARDEAFQFYYRDNLDLLEEAGARIVYWSPLHDGTLPAADGLYLGGGYPELYRARCRPMRPCSARCGPLPSRTGPSTPSAVASCIWPSRSPIWTVASGPWSGCCRRPCAWSGVASPSATARWRSWGQAPSGHRAPRARPRVPPFRAGAGPAHGRSRLLDPGRP